MLASLAHLVDSDTAKTVWHTSDVSLANGPPTGSCESRKTDDGYGLTGSWNLSSGIAHANWLIGMAKAEIQDGNQTPMMHLFPKSAANIDKTWDVGGLGQTGSYHFAIEELLVPKHLAFT